MIRARDQGLRELTVISQHRFDPGPAELRRLLDKNALGRLVLGEAATKWHGTQEYYDSAAWRGTWALDGGSLLNQGIHYVDLLRWCMGPVADVTAKFATRAHRVETEDIAVAVLTFASGALGTIVTSTAACPGSAQRLEITGTEGTVVIEDGQITRRALAIERPESAGNATAHPAATDPAATDPAAAAADDPAAAANAAAIGASAHAAQVADLLVAIEEGREPSVTGRDGRAALELACAVYESARQGRTVALPVAPDRGAETTRQ
ncbi:MAG TPA: Gfo/Idh/MocA family oxidoreductase [Streptosporangiaceae bacterium]